MTSAVEILRWDSRFFGRRIARLKSARLTSAGAASALKTCAQERVKGLYFLAAAHDLSSAACAQSHGFRLVDIRVTLQLDLHTRPPFDRPMPSTTVFRAARAGDVPALRRLAGTLFPNSRFAVDAHFPKDSHRRLFAEWIAKSVRHRFDDWVLVAQAQGRLAGFVSCRRTGAATGAIGLLGVDHSFRGRGIGRGLLQEAFAWFRSKNIRQVKVATQGRAADAQAFYQDSGFRTSRVDLWYHKWF